MQPVNRIFLNQDDSRLTPATSLLGVGVEEAMPPGHITRRRGFPAWLFIHFHTDVTVELKGRGVRLPAGTGVLWGRGRPHVYGSAPGGWNHSWVVFNDEEAQPELRAASRYLEEPLHLSRGNQLRGYLANILREFRDFGRPHPSVVSANLRLLLCEVVREQEQQASVLQKYDPVSTAVSHMEQHLGQPLRVGDIASAAGLSASRLQQRFRERHGQTLQRYLEGRRLQEARYWLTHSGLRITEVAERVGFADPLYFSRRFRKAMGMSPGQYRKSQSA